MGANAWLAGLAYVVALRSIWNGTIAFAGVFVPVKVHSATEDRTVHFHEVHVDDGARIEHKRICPKEDKEVPSSPCARRRTSSSCARCASRRARPGRRPRRLDALAQPEQARTRHAGQLVATLEAKFDPAAFEDTYRERLLAYIEAKARASSTPCLSPPRLPTPTT